MVALPLQFAKSLLILLNTISLHTFFTNLTPLFCTPGSYPDAYRQHIYIALLFVRMWRDSNPHKVIYPRFINLSAS